MYCEGGPILIIKPESWNYEQRPLGDFVWNFQPSFSRGKHVYSLKNLVNWNLRKISTRVMLYDISGITNISAHKHAPQFSTQIHTWKKRVATLKFKNRHEASVKWVWNKIYRKAFFLLYNFYEDHFCPSIIVFSVQSF